MKFAFLLQKLKVISAESFTFVVMKVLCIIFLALLISFQSFSKSYTVFTENGKVGLKNELGQVLIPPHYEQIGWSNGEFSVINNVTGFRIGHLWGLINLENHRLTKQEFEELLPADGQLIIAKKKTRTSIKPLVGCVNSSGKEVIPFQYDGISISSLRAIVFTRIGNDFKYGVIDLENKTIVPQLYQEIKAIGTLRFAVKNFDDKIALYTDQGKQVTPFTIDSISFFYKNAAIFFENGSKGIIDRDGQIRLAAKYRDIAIQPDGSFKVKKVDTWRLHDGANKVVREYFADSVTVVAPNLYRIRTMDRCWLSDSQFKPMGNVTFSDIGEFRNGIAPVRSDGHYGAIDKSGNLVLQPIFNKVSVTEAGIIVMERRDGQYAFSLFDVTGVRKTARSYEDLVPAPNGMFAAKNRKHWGIVNQAGQEVVACVYDSLVQFKDDLIVVKFRGQYGIIDTAEKWIAPPRGNRLQLIGNSRYLEFAPDATHLKAQNGSVIYFTSNKFIPFSDYLLETTSSGDIWKIDFNGVIVDRQHYPRENTEKVYEESEGYRVIKRNGRYGFVDSKGRLRIANRYEDVGPFKEGFAAVKILGKWGFINLADNISVQPVYEQVFPFNNGRALVKQKGFFGLIDISGKLILPVRYEKIQILPTKNILIMTNGQAGLADHSGTILVSPRFRSINDTGKDFVVVEKAGKYGVVGYNGISTIPMIYDFVTFDPHENLFLVLEKKDWQIMK
jgi:hypothetical protein